MKGLLFEITKNTVNERPESIEEKRRVQERPKMFTKFANKSIPGANMPPKLPRDSMYAMFIRAACRPDSRPYITTVWILASDPLSIVDHAT